MQSTTGLEAGACKDAVCLVIHNVGRLHCNLAARATGADCCSHAADYCECDTRDVVKYGVQGSPLARYWKKFDKRRPRLVR